MRERVLGPLGIGDAELAYTIPDSLHHAHGYLEKWSFMNLAKWLLIDRQFIGDYEGSWLRIEPHYLNGPPFGGLVGTAQAFGRFLSDAVSPQSVVLDEPARAGLWAEQTTTAGYAVPMTLGWHVGDLGRDRFHYKEGGGGGFHAEMRVYRERGVATVVMSNATAFDVKGCLNRCDPAFLHTG